LFAAQREEKAMSVITVALSIVTGICIWAGVDQLLIGLRRMRERAHLIFAVFCFLAAGYVLTAIIGYQAASVDAFASVLKRKVALLALTGVTFLWFVAIHTRVQPFGLLLILSSVFAASSALNLLAPYGLLYDEISALTDVELAWGGTIVLPEATSNVWRLILFVGFAALVGFTCYACFQQYRAGKRTSALTLGVGVAVLVAAVLHDIYINAMGITSVRLMEFGFAALVIVISLNLSNQIIAIANIKRELYESVSRYRSLYNNTPLMLHSTDREGHLLTVNNHWLETLGYERDQVIGCCYTEFLAEGCRQYFEEVALSALWRTGSVKDVALQMVNKGGEVIDVEMSAIAERDVRGDLTRSIAFLIDIAERKRVENELHEHCEQLEELVEKRTLALARADEQLQQESADRLRVEASLWEMQATLDGILESAMDAIVTVDGDYQIVLFNPAAERMFGYTMAEVKGRPLNHLMPSEFHETHTDDIREFGRTGATARRMGNGKVTWGIRADGERFPVEASISRIDVAGKRYFTAIVRDITERAHV
jgi:PAS domain S-box-containing protein